MKFTLRSKGLAAIAALVIYIGAMAVTLSSQRQDLLTVAVELEHTYKLETQLANTAYAVAQSMLKVQEKFVEVDVDNTVVEELSLDVELIEGGLRTLESKSSAISDYRAALLDELSALRQTPARSGLVKLRETEVGLHRLLDQTIRGTEERKRQLWEAYRRSYDMLTVLAITMGLIGAVGFAVLISHFFNRLVWDIRKVQKRALEIVRGYRDVPLEVSRKDELGSLMKSINRMQIELRRREQNAEISGEQRFHQEKMAAVGSLAAAIAHEINNPIAAITGIAESMRSTHSLNAAGQGISCDAEAEMIIAQSKRIGLISRQLAELTRPTPHEPALLDLNELVRNTCNFVRYDRRFYKITLNLELKEDIPAVEAVADHLTQILMNLLINAADALEPCRDREHHIQVATCCEDGAVRLTITDNGEGAPAEVLARVFEDSFTTKPPGKGRGLGLFLCRTLIESAGGRIELDSVLGKGTRVSVHMPLTHARKPVTE